MFFAKTLVLSAILATLAQAAPIPDEEYDDCWVGDDEPISTATRLPPAPKITETPLPPAQKFPLIDVSSVLSSYSSAHPSTTQVNYIPEVTSLASQPSPAEKAKSAKASATPKKSNTSANPAASLSGQATTYGGNTKGGACSFSTLDSIPAGLYGVATANWDGSANCGSCVKVTGPKGNSITAMITDECPGCGTNHLDLYPDAYAKLDSNPGVISVTWEYVDCGITAPLSVHNKQGVSKDWFSMQVVGANEATSKLEASPDGGKTWLSGKRMPYNFFEISSGTKSTTADIRVTSKSGKVVTIKNVQIVPDASTKASSNY